MDKLYNTNTPIKNPFPQTKVIGRLRYSQWEDEDSPYYDDEEKELLEFINEDGDVVLTVGTDHGDSYYPSLVSAFHPENLPINKNKS